MKKPIAISMLAVSALTSCGPSQEELAAREKFVADSVAQVVIDQQEAAQRRADSLAALEAEQSALKEQLIDLKAQLKVEEVNLHDIEQFQFLRTAAEKQEQVESQAKLVESLKIQIADVEKRIIQ